MTRRKLRFPMFVKSLVEEGSYGIAQASIVTSEEKLVERVTYLQNKLDTPVIAEEYIEGREFYVGVIGNQDLTAFPPLEMDFSGLSTGAVKIMDSEAKFDTTSDRFKGTKVVLPDLEPELKARLQKVSVEAYRALRVCDYGRIDLRLKETGEIFVIEVNASCYLEKNSEFATAAAAQGIAYPDLLNRIAELALERWKHRAKAQRKRKKARTAALALA